MKTNSLTLGHSILTMTSRDPKHVAIKFKAGNKWTEKSWKEYYQDIETMGAALLSLGIKPGDRVAIMANTRYEWSVSDYAIFGIKAITVPIYQNNIAEDVEYILNNSKARFLICESRGPLKTFESIQSKCPHVEKILLMDTSHTPSENLPWNQLMKIGQEYLAKNPTCYRDLCATLKTDDMATILYTSGTTGLPKGVVLTHLQAFNEVSEAFPFAGAVPSDVSLTFLPYAHILGRIEHWGHMFIGFTMAYAESLEKVRNNLADVRPTILVSVPRIFEKIHSAILAQVQTQPLKLKLFNWAVEVGREVGEYKLSGQILPIGLLAKYELAKKLVLGKITEAFGGRLRFAISGGAPISKEIAMFFHSAGILILEGYGLTETTAAITVNTPFNYRFGSVGRPIGDVELKVAADGEILVKSSKVMREYYQNPDATKEAFTDGWFHTGDIGEIMPSGDLRITDRKKDLIKTAGGKYVAPQRLETLLVLSPYISHALIHGDQKKYIVALIFPDQAAVTMLAKEKGIKFGSWDELVTSPFVEELIRNAVADANSQLASYESIKKHIIMRNELTVENGELTPSMKLKRKKLDQKFSTEIEKMYA
ncbi:long-chain fatty acid--CoA ligase [Bdellovibrio sp. SKB1291214]|uniref:AMP-dependent synthetase/ligase n=1 Tax=Bdellovibrio sp. SKB1291214 TaxID=1732569 RepID=UPI000B516B1A|nr:long-chain fatty acid--CoA ligase [Bdellovibrio sp. SKB1291214]UYL08797.1 long-chain fatty acid--CoA ligase [Bdellovibrio sp. SKB1291214]